MPRKPKETAPEAPEAALDPSSGEDTAPAPQNPVAGQITPPMQPGEAVPIMSTASELVSEHLDSIPDPTKPPPEEMENVNDGLQDKAGNVFDPLRHKVDREGKPRLDRKGYFIPLNKGRPPGIPQRRSTGESAPASHPATDESEVYGALFVDTGTSVLAGVFQDDNWLPENASERKNLVTCVAAYLRTKEEMDIPPGLALAMGLSVYAGKRIAKPTIREKIGIFFHRVKNFFRKKPKDSE